jgi:hypothetical protein
MKIVELLAGKIQLPITNEEAEVLGKFSDVGQISRRDLNEREVYIANQLVNKDVLTRKNNNGQISYTKKINN